MLDIWFNLCKFIVPAFVLSRSPTLPSSITGPTATEFLEYLTPSSLKELPKFSSTLSVLLNEGGGIIDDTIICKHADDKFYVVTNAGRRDRDLQWFDHQIKEWNSSSKSEAGKVEIEVLEGWGLVALQGSVMAITFQETPLTLTPSFRPQGCRISRRDHEVGS